jgi:hypothetical protein
MLVSLHRSCTSRCFSICSLYIRINTSNRNNGAVQRTRAVDFYAFSFMIAFKCEDNREIERSSAGGSCWMSNSNLGAPKAVMLMGDKRPVFCNSSLSIEDQTLILGIANQSYIFYYYQHTQ